VSEVESQDRTSCAGCSGSRRDFLRDVAGAVGGLTLLLGLSSRDAAALTLGFVRGERFGSMLRYPVPGADSAVIDRDNEIIMVRHARRAYAFALSCPHQRTMLKWYPQDSRFQCPKHKSKYQPDGTFISGRATRGMDRLAIRLQSGELVVDPATVYREDKNAAGWKAAFVALR
jgi:nitrite reductase/ring-hydroxylating ferredoxin subunit